MRKNPAAVSLGRKGGQAKSAAKTIAVRANAQLPRRRVIQFEGQEEGTYWIYLKPGYHRDGEHAIAGNTRAEAKAWLPAVERCDCEECRHLIAKAKVKL